MAFTLGKALCWKNFILIDDSMILFFFTLD